MPRPESTSKSPKRRPWIRWIALAALLFLAWQVFTGPRGLLKLSDLLAQKRALVHQIDSLETRKRELVQERKRLLTDTAYLEKLARKELGMARPGERVYRFVTPASPDSGPERRD
jgi:cell division protein FtsB